MGMGFLLTQSPPQLQHYPLPSQRSAQLFAIEVTTARELISIKPRPGKNVQTLCTLIARRLQGVGGGMLGDPPLTNRSRARAFGAGVNTRNDGCQANSLHPCQTSAPPGGRRSFV